MDEIALSLKNMPMLKKLLTPILLMLMAAPPVSADERPRRRAEDGASSSRRGGTAGSRRGRMAIEGGKTQSIEVQKRKETLHEIKIVMPLSCGTRKPGKFRKHLLSIKNPNDSYNVELWGNHQRYYVSDKIRYFVRSNRNSWVTLFWIGPKGSVFVPFSNVKVEANRDHVIDPDNIIVEPVGRERWVVLATLEPHVLPCTGTDGMFVSAFANLRKRGLWSIGRWDVRSFKTRKRRKRLRRRN
jgi:hypothetical protein